jgi:UDP-3-O-[3-hydroxymyristoyl] glucosamine N-acyltransferase
VGNVTAAEIARFLNAELEGDNIAVLTVSSLGNVKDNSVTFFNSTNLDLHNLVLVLVPMSFSWNGLKEYSVIRVKDPRLAFAKVTREFFIQTPIYSIHETATVGQNCNVNQKVVIGANCCIGSQVSIGKGTVINHGVIINDGTIIGENCYIKSGAIIGEDGFGFAMEDDGTPVRIPHVGLVVIGNNVEIGSKNTIARGTIDNTIIEDNVKIDDQVHIAHNCRIGRNTIITACSEISGSVQVGEACWIGPNSCIKQKITIGDNVTIGIGAIIVDDVPSNKKMMGFESLDLRSLLRFKKNVNFPSSG